MKNPLDHFPVIPVIVIEDVESAQPLAEALLAGGLKIIEITFRTQAAAAAIKSIVDAYPEMNVGAGTVITTEQAQMAIDAGSQFGLAPGTDPAIIEHFAREGIPFIPGVMTPTDIQQALKAGCQRMKFFPAGAAGGPKLLQAISAPYAASQVKFCPTGGVTLQNMSEYLSMPSVFAVGGTWIATPAQIAEKQWSVITQQAREAIEKSRV